MGVTWVCACCAKDVHDDDSWQTSDGRRWCPDHGPLAVKLQRQAMARGELDFTMPGPVLLEVRARIARNNRRRFGP